MASGQRKIVSVASGKGGVGKTLSSVHLAIAASRMGLRTLIFDGDLGLANVDVVLRIQVKKSVADVLSGSSRLAEIVVSGPCGVSVIPSGSGFARLANLKLTERLSLLDQLEELMAGFDLVVIDTGAGISESVLHLNSFAHATIVVTTPEPTAMTDAYAFIKVMHQKYGESRFKLLVNQVVSATQGLKVSQQISDVCLKYLNLRIQHLGSIPKDKMISRLVMLNGIGVEESIQTIAGQAWNEVAWDMLTERPQSDDGKEIDWLSFVFPDNQITTHSL